jgi:L-fuculokinase
MLEIPIKVLDDAETTVSGAAMFGWYGVGEFASAGQARAQVTISTATSTRKPNPN